MLDFEQAVGWYGDLAEAGQITCLPDRYRKLRQHHDESLALHLPFIHQMTSEQAAEPVPGGWHRRDVVAHIKSWQEKATEAFKSPDSDQISQLLLRMGYESVDPFDFYKANPSKVDQLNKSIVKTSRRSPWTLLQSQALYSAKELSRQFPKQPKPEILKKLEGTKDHKWHIIRGIDIPAGWYLWMVAIEHQSLQHFSDLRAPIS